MALIKRNLASIIGTFSKTLAELDAFVTEQEKRKVVAANNVAKLSELIDVQADISADATKQIGSALKVRRNIAALIE